MTAEALRALFHVIEAWYDPRRRPSALGNDPGVTHERKHPEVLVAARLETVHRSGFTPRPDRNAPEWMLAAALAALA